MFICVYLSFLLCGGLVLVDGQILLEEAKTLFEDFIIKYKRNYENEKEKQMRYEIFKENLLEIRKGNLRQGSEVLGINLFSDISKEEFKRSHLGCYAEDLMSSCEKYYGGFLGNAPESLDWREKGVVTPVKDQLRCGSCWAFSAIANIESQYAITHNELLDLSEQQEVDCDRHNGGCVGGVITRAFKNLNEVGGLMEEADYPYIGKDGHCEFKPDKVKTKVTGCLDFTGTKEEDIKELLARYGPLTVALAGEPMQQYKGGVATDCEGKIDHALLLVGYGVDNKTDEPYWILKNSWGEGFGENGYIRLIRGQSECKVGLHQLATSQVA